MSDHRLNQTSTRGALGAARSLLRDHQGDANVSAYDLDASSASDQCAALFLRGARRHDLRYVEHREFPRRSHRVPELEELGEIELSWRLHYAHEAVVWLDSHVLALVVADKGEGVVAVAARSTAAAQKGAATLERRLREEPDAPSDIEVSFWTGGADPWRSRRRIEAPLLDEVVVNYPHSVRAQVEWLANLQDPQGGGSLLLWHGPPGTGKSWALRALAREWREWCSTHYVTDPESFLGSGTQYLMQIVRERSDEARPWQLIALEDAGELMAADARSETGQALSRLLNLTDGLLGQGLRTLVVVTTNEKIGRLHPAVRRPGRCLAAIGFERFSAQEGSAWLARHGTEVSLDRPATLAELYARRDGRELGPETTERFGFAAALGG